MTLEQKVKSQLAEMAWTIMVQAQQIEELQEQLKAQTAQKETNEDK